MKKNIKDYEYKGKKVILRCDLNVPMENKKITDDTRIKESLLTINYLINHDAKVIILSHLGKIVKEEDKADNSLYPVYLKLKDMLNTNVYFSNQTKGEELEEKISKLKNREVLLVENTRYEDIDGKKESSCDETISRYWASLGDIYINDAYGTSHRAHASNVGISKLLPNAIGLLMEKEISKLDEIMNENTHPFIVIMGGKKISDKIPIIENLIDKCDKLLIGGGMCFTFLKSQNIEVGASIVDNENISFCKNMLNKYKDKIILPIDIVTNNKEIKEINKLDNSDVGYDIGPKTIKLFTDNLQNAKRVIVNGPMGVFEDKYFSKGTDAIYRYLKENNIKTLIGGGDSAASVNILGYQNSFFHISTGGGATLDYLSGKSLPGLDAIGDKKWE